jgi:hypothetical protein
MLSKKECLRTLQLISKMESIIYANTPKEVQKNMMDVCIFEEIIGVSQSLEDAILSDKTDTK